MKRDIKALLKEALVLPATDRAALAEALLASLDEHADDAAENDRESEIERRIAELDAGVVSPIPWPEVRRRLFERARRRALGRLRDGLDLGWSAPAAREDLYRR